MKSISILALSALLGSFAARADTAFISEGVLTLPEVVVTQAEGVKFFTDVKLTGNADGTFSVHSFQPQLVASVGSISLDAIISTGTPAVVSLQGVKAPECVRFEPARITRRGNTFHLLLIEKEIPPNMSCLAGQFPFIEYAVLDTADLEPGAYFVSAHGLTVGFRLTKD